MSEIPTEPHAYGVETLWNRGGFSERWGLSMEMNDFRHPLGRDDAEQLFAEMINDGHAADAVRVVAISVAAPAPTPPPALTVRTRGAGR